MHVLGILVGGGIVGGWTYTVDWTSSEVREVLSSTEVKGNHKPTSLTLRTKCGLPDKQPSLANGYRVYTCMQITNHTFFAHVTKRIDAFIKFSKLYINISTVFYLFSITACNSYYHKLNSYLF